MNYDLITFYITILKYPYTRKLISTQVEKQLQTKYKKMNMPYIGNVNEVVFSKRIHQLLHSQGHKIQSLSCCTPTPVYVQYNTVQYTYNSTCIKVHA